MNIQDVRKAKEKVRLNTEWYNIIELTHTNTHKRQMVRHTNTCNYLRWVSIKCLKLHTVKMCRCERMVKLRHTHTHVLSGWIISAEANLYLMLQHSKERAKRDNSAWVAPLHLRFYHLSSSFSSGSVLPTLITSAVLRLFPPYFSCCLSPSPHPVFLVYFIALPPLRCFLTESSVIPPRRQSVVLFFAGSELKKGA